MGLDFNNSDAHWSYSGFNRFRTRLAESIGIKLDSMQGFAHPNEGISWSTIKDPIKPLLYHSDCDGQLTVSEMKLVAPRLIEIVSKWDSFEDSFDRNQAEILAKDMFVCIKHNTPLEFC